MICIKFKNDEPEDLNMFLDWVELNREEFKRLLGKKRFKSLEKEKNGDWEMKDNIKITKIVP